MYISEFESGMDINQFFLLDQVIKGTASNGKNFLTLVLKDRTGSVDAKIWEVKPEDYDNLKIGELIHISALANDYRGKIQLKVNSYRLKEEHEELNIEDFIQTAPLAKEEMIADLNIYLNDIENPKLKAITSEILKKYKNEFVVYPAAKSMHHDFYSGLIYHTVTMLKIAKSLIEIYPSLNKDLLYAGVILHDVGKTVELSGPISTTYTLEGELLGHISIISDEIVRAAEKLGIDGEEIVLLRHLVLSHHGQLEFGSPKRPMLKEAEILNFIDNIDARMQMFDKNLSKLEPGTFSERIFGLENRQFYVTKFDKE
ncbi:MULTISPECIES: HD domain-containing protein [unclassified Gemella]|uniref:HD domain-containing protein n=1 Tax=unclassified Gemella TaxID=2624949 RepID=UPI001073A823|nr:MULTISPECIES: HD domain-containing protein [unclassified Gemella]MBF0709693.1 HD domain-containing protein [Gemella sp. GL1.1]MBF0746888.1 HD domain-containing protein [Gemella sp. 19428wG2_WT2a]NYS27037.1 HD domain-containing protein [Gemella sp. GL1]TFU59117.1 HD domain-containing protein [Gemella sp. WT2a]